MRFPRIDLWATGKNIEKLRREKGFTVRQMQDFFGFEQPQAIYKWQRGECLPSVDHLFALSKLLQVSMQDILIEMDQDIPSFGRGEWIYGRQRTLCAAG